MKLVVIGGKREVLQNEFRYDFRKGPRESSAGMVITVLKAKMHVNTVNTVPAEISRGPFRKSYRNSFCKTSLRPLFFISLFLVTSARSFRQELKKKKIDHWSWAAKFHLSQTWSCTPTTTSSASEAYHSFASSVAVPVHSLLRKRFHWSPVCTSCVPRMLCEGGACSHSRAEADGTWLPDQVTDLAWTLRCVWSQLKKTKVCTSACLWPDAVWGYWDFFWEGEIIFFSVRSVAFLRKMWRETEIKITVA